MRMLKAGLMGLTLATLFASTAPLAQVRYEANLSHTNAEDWSTRSSKISCLLSYNIDKYGRADFTLLSGSNHKLSLEVFPFIEINNKSLLRVVSAPPEWRPQGIEKDIGEISLYRGFRPFVGNSVSWAILRELSRGQRILLPYMSTNGILTETIVPVLSPMGFNKAYAQFIDCSSQLIDVGFADVELVALTFFEKENRLTPASEERLKKQITYAKLDPSVNKIIISAFGSGNADDLDNLNLAKQRAENLSKIYTDAGFKKELIEIKTYGDEQLSNTGYTAADRQESSKAIVKLQRDPFKVDRRLEVDLPDVGAPDEYIDYDDAP